MCIDPSRDHTATIHTDRGDIVIQLDAETVPITVNNFVFLARWHFYDGVDFHRVVPGFVIQAGDAIGDPPGTGGPGYVFEDEATPSEPSYLQYSVAMANAGPDTNGSQFFIVTGTETDLPPEYTLFGQVIEGQAVVDEIDATGIGDAADGAPSEPTVIDGVTITEQ